jgi:hypothetical protein
MQIFHSIFLNDVKREFSEIFHLSSIIDRTLLVFRLSAETFILRTSFVFAKKKSN